MIAQHMTYCFENIEKSLYKIVDFIQGLDKAFLLLIDQTTLINIIETLEKFATPIYDFEKNKSETRRRFLADLLRLKLQIINATCAQITPINFQTVHEFFKQIQNNIDQLLKLMLTIHKNAKVEQPATIQYNLRKLMAFEPVLISTPQFSRWTPQVTAQRFYPTYEKIVFLQQYQQRLMRL